MFVVLGAALGLGAFGVGENPVEKAIAMTLDDLGDPANIDQVGADADDHAVPAFRNRPAATFVHRGSHRTNRLLKADEQGLARS